MATAPKAHLGLIRTFDLLETLIDDFNKSMELLMADQESQFLRRIVVRNAFVFLEGIIQILKYEIKRSIRLEITSYKLTNRENELVYEKKQLIDGSTIIIFIPIEKNFPKTITLANKILNPGAELLAIKEKEMQIVMAAKDTRNKLTHPRNYYDIEISDYEILVMIQVFDLGREFFGKIFSNKTNEFATADLPKS